MIPGLGAETPEQLTDKLESTKKIIEEVNKQFKNPVRICMVVLWLSNVCMHIGFDYICLCLYTRILVTLRDRAPGARAD
jgi:hypothetical protein